MSVSSYRYLGDGDTDRHEILHDVRYRSWTGRLPFESNPKYQILTANISKNGNSQRYVARRHLSKNVGL